jgi:hypothetical protein
MYVAAGQDMFPGPSFGFTITVKERSWCATMLRANKVSMTTSGGTCVRSFGGAYVSSKRLQDPESGFK